MRRIWQLALIRPFRSTRKTDCGAGKFLLRCMVRAAPVALFATLLMGTAYNPSWMDSPVAQWSEDDAKQLLANSPWAKNVHVDKVRNLSPFERRDSGDWEAGIPSGIGIAELGLMADWRDIEALEHAYAVANLGMVTVRWESVFRCAPHRQKSASPQPRAGRATTMPLPCTICGLRSAGTWRTG